MLFLSNRVISVSSSGLPLLIFQLHVLEHQQGHPDQYHRVMTVAVTHGVFLNLMGIEPWLSHL